MNCDTCAVKLTGVTDLMQHVSKIRQNYQCSHFFCIPCSLPIHNLSNVIEHIASEEHSFMVLATGIHFDVKSESSDSLDTPFPPLSYCLLCSCRDDNSYAQHMKNSAHRKIASLMRTIIISKKVYCSATDKETHRFLNKMISMKKEELIIHRKIDSFSDTFDCDLCNIFFNKEDFFKRHLENKSHKRVEQFMIKLSKIVEGVEYVDLDSYEKVSKTFSNSLPPLFYCELCDVWISTTAKYVRHAKSVTHARIQEFHSKLSNKRDGEVITLRGVESTRDSHFFRSKEYCKLCTVWGATGYRRHLKDAGHLRIEKFLNGLTSEERKFLKVYMTAQANLKVDNSTPPNYCVICNILCSESEEYKKHLESEEHKYVKKYYPKNKNYVGENGFKKQTYSTLLRQRYYAMLHKQQKNNYPDPEASETDSSSEGSNSSAPQEHYCELCEFLCYSVLHYDKHLMGDQHKRMRRLLNKKHTASQPCESSSNSHPLLYKCELCEVFNSGSKKYEIHLNSALHKKNQWLLYVLKQRPI